MDSADERSNKMERSAAGTASPLRIAVREDHDRTIALLSHFRDAWLHGDVDTARRRFTTFETGVLRHLEWEERMLIEPFREKLPVLADLDMLRGDVVEHRDLRKLLARVKALLPGRTRGDTDLDRRILEHVDLLETLLASHRLVIEGQLCEALDSVLTPSAQEELARSLSEGPSARPD